MSIGGHHSARSGSVEWLTPPEIIDALGGWEANDLDPAAPIERPWPTARLHFTVQDDGLLQRWADDVWLNPPYTTSLVERFMARLAEHGKGIALIFARTETEWWFRHIWNRATAVLFMGPHRIHFHHLDGRRAKHNAGAPTALVAYGIKHADRLADSGISGAFVPLTGSDQILAVFRPANDDKSYAEILGELCERQGGKITPAIAYVLMAQHPKTATNPNWKAQIRKVLQGSRFERVAPATYRRRRVA